MKFGCSDLLEF